MLRQKPAFQLVVGRRLQASAGFESRLLLLLLFYAVATPIVLLILSSRLHSHSRTSSLHGPADPYGWSRVRNWAQNWQSHQTRSLQSKQVSRVKQGHLDTRLLVDKLAEQRHGSIIKSAEKLHGGSHQLHAPINKSKMPAVRPKTIGQTDIRPIKRRKVGDFMVTFYAHVSELCFLPRTATFQTDALWNALCLAEETLICRTFYSNCLSMKTIASPVLSSNPCPLLRSSRLMIGRPSRPFCSSTSGSLRTFRGLATARKT